MTPGERRDHVTVLVVSGPIGSGKTSWPKPSTAACRERGHTAAVVDLDVVYEVLDHRYPWADSAVWQRARRLIGAMTEACFAARSDPGSDAVGRGGVAWLPVAASSIAWYT